MSNGDAPPEARSATVPNIGILLRRPKIGGRTLGRLVIENMMANLRNEQRRENTPLPMTQEQLSALERKLSTDKSMRDYEFYTYLERICWDIHSSLELMTWSFHFGATRLNLIAYVRQKHGVLALDELTYNDIESGYVNFIIPPLKKMLTISILVQIFEDIFKVDLSPMDFRLEESLSKIGRLNTDLNTFCRDDAAATEKLSRFMNLDPAAFRMGPRYMNEYRDRLDLSFRYDSPANFWRTLNGWRGAVASTIQ